MKIETKGLTQKQYEFMVRLKTLFLFYNKCDMTEKDNYYAEKEDLINELMESDLQ